MSASSAGSAAATVPSGKLLKKTSGADRPADVDLDVEVVIIPSQVVLFNMSLEKVRTTLSNLKSVGSEAAIST